MKHILTALFLIIFIDSYGQVKSFDFPDTLMVYGNATDDYGLSPYKPIKVGGGTLPKHVYRYLNNLVDSAGTRLKYKRVGSCCTEETKRAKPLTLFKIFTNYGNEILVYFDQYEWEFPKVIRTAHWKESRKGYYGEYANDTVFNGHGVYFFDDGGYYQGDWKLGIMEGKGKYFIPEQETYYGALKNGEYDGFGCITYHDGSVYEGEWLKGKKHGKGKLYYPKGMEIVVVEGIFEQDKPKGKVKVTYKNGEVKYGSF